MLLNAHVPSINKYRRKGAVNKHLYLLSSWCIFILERENTALQYFYIYPPHYTHKKMLQPELFLTDKENGKARWSISLSEHITF